MGISSSRQARICRIGRSLMIWTNIILALFTIASAYGGVTDPRTTVIPAFALMMFPFTLAASFILLILDILLCRRAIVLMLVCIAVCSVPAYNICPLRLSVSTIPNSEYNNRIFTVMTYNVFNFIDVSNGPDTINGKPYNPALECILARHPDIVCTQESRMFSDPYLRRKYPDIIDSLTIHYPYQLSFDSNIIISRWPMEKVETGLSPDDSFVPGCVKIKIEGHELYVINLHLQSIGLTTEDKALFRDVVKLEASGPEIKNARYEIGGKLAYAFRKRASQAHIIRGLIDSISGNLIVCGDFNDVPGCFAIRTIRGKDLRDAYQDGGSGATITYNKNKYFFRIDHILYRGDFRAIRTVRDANRGSDHYPLIATFEWKKPI